MDVKKAISLPAKRQSNIELLRIIAMVMIIAHHIAVHSGFSFPAEVISVNRLWIQFIRLGGKIGVDIFVLISGYFLVTSKNLQGKKVVKLWLQIFSYSTGIFVIFFFFNNEPLSFNNVSKGFLPITFSCWWFASTYFILFLIYPFLNRLINSLSKKEYQQGLLILALGWCVIPTVFQASWQVSNLLWFIFVYALAGYIRLHFDVSKLKSAKCLLVTFSLTALTFLATVFFDILRTKVPFFNNHPINLYEMNSLPILIISVALFVSLLSFNVGYKPIINVISSATFGVYLIHDNWMVRNALWHRIFKNANYSDSKFLVLYTIAQIVIVFIVCTAIELFRIYVIEKLYIRHIDSFLNAVNGCIKKFVSCKPIDKFIKYF